MMGEATSAASIVSASVVEERQGYKKGGRGGKG